MKLVKIEWIDSRGVTPTWEDKDNLEPLLPAKCQTVGWLIESTKTYKTVVQSIGEEEVLGRITIPTGCITSVKELVEGRA